MVRRRGLAMGFIVKQGSEKGSEKGFLEGGFRRCQAISPLTISIIGIYPNLRKSPNYPN